MALIERVSLNESHLILDRSVPVGDDSASNEEAAVKAVHSFPGLRISSRLTTSSLSDYESFDLNSIGRGDKQSQVTDGSCS